MNASEHGATGYAPATLVFGVKSVEERQMLSRERMNTSRNPDQSRDLNNNFEVMRNASVKF